MNGPKRIFVSPSGPMRVTCDVCCSISTYTRSSGFNVDDAGTVKMLLLRRRKSRACFSMWRE